MQIAIIGAGFTPEEADRLRRALATFKKHRHHPHLPRAVPGGHGGERLCRGLRRTLLQPDRGLRRVRLSREPCGELRASGLCLGLAQVPPSGGLRLRAAQFAAHGLLRPGADRARRARAWRRGAPGLRQCQRTGTTRWSPTGGAASRCASAFARSRACARTTRTGSRRRGATATATSRASGGERAPPPRAGAGRGRRLRRARASTRREALWQVRAIGGETPLPLFAGIEGEGERRAGRAAADDARRGRSSPTTSALRLTLRAHPMALLRGYPDAGLGGGGKSPAACPAAFSSLPSGRA